VSSSGRRALAALAAIVVALCGPVARAGAEPALAPGFQDEVVFDGIEQPTNFVFAADDRVFVSTKAGEILVYDDLEDDSPEVFADLRGDVYDSGDRGLLGLELDSGFTTGRPYVYALYTWDHVLGTTWDPADPEYGQPGTAGDPTCPLQNLKGNCLVSGRLVRLTEDSLNPSHAIELGGMPVEQELLQGWCQQFDSHSVGDLGFGPEGALYVSGGDGASYESEADYGQLGANGYQNACADPHGGAPGSKGIPLNPPDTEGGALRSQNMSLLNGAILRIDPDTGAAYPGNPLSLDPDPNARRTIAKGFRNPFRFAFDAQTGELYTGNVGSSEIEEIDRFPAPPTSLYNSGWPCYEGIQEQFRFKQIVAADGLEVCERLYDASPEVASLPFFNYSHLQAVVPNDECPITAGSAVGGVSLYDGSQFPAAYNGALFFADAVRGCIWVMTVGSDGKPDPSTTTRFMREGKIYPGVKIAEGPDGNLYYADLFGDEHGDAGAIHRIVYAPGAPTARLEATPPYGLYDQTGSLEVDFDATGSSDPSAEALSYAWDMDGDGSFELSGPGVGATEHAVYTQAEQEEREDDEESPDRVVSVRVEDGVGLSSVGRVTVYPGDKPPVPQITAPAPSFKWAVGDPIKLNASAVDAEGNSIQAPLPYYWITRLAHCPDPAHPTACHVHPLQTFSGIRRPEFFAPQHDFPSYIEVILRVSDERGLSGSVSMSIEPETVGLRLASLPRGIQLEAGSTNAASPFAIPAILGSELQISAPATAIVDSRTYTWKSWSDGGARIHTIKASGADCYQAIYTSPEDAGLAGPCIDPGPPVAQAPVAQAVGTAPDTTGPVPKLGAHPPRKTASKVARFAFSASERSSFRCKLDRRPFRPCTSPKLYRALGAGRHTFKLIATDAAGNAGRRVTFAWKVLAPKPRRR
jgi:glucose/arabinose dehydrogenase